MANISRFNFPSDKKVTAHIVDNSNNTFWIAFEKNSEGNSIIERVAKFNPKQTYFSLERTVEEVTAMDLSSSFLYVAYDDGDLLGERISLFNPLTSTTDISKGSYIESPVDVKVDGSNVWFLLPGNTSGENAKLLRHSTAGVFQLEVDLTKSAVTITNAERMSIDSNGDIWITTYTTPGTLVRVFEVSTDVYDFTVHE